MRSRAIGVAGADMLCQVDLPVSVPSGSVNPNSQENIKDTCALTSSSKIHLAFQPQSHW